MYYREDENRWYSSPRDYQRVRLWTLMRNGFLTPIEGFSQYTVTREGVVYNIDRARPLKPFRNGHQTCVGLTSDEGKRTTMPLARLVAYHYIPLPDTDQYYDVSFKDGDHENFDAANLEWMPRWKRLAKQENYNVDIS